MLLLLIQICNKLCFVGHIFITTSINNPLYLRETLKMTTL